MLQSLNRRWINAGGFAACAGMMGFALFAEHVLMLMPCPLCTFQRLAVILLGLFFLIAALHNPKGAGRFVYAGLIGLAAAGGAGVAGWHVYIQNLPPDQVPSCGPGLDYMVDNFPFTDVLRMVFTGSGECAEISWQFLGLSMPAWVLLCAVILGVVGVWNNLRSSPTAT